MSTQAEHPLKKALELAAERLSKLTPSAVPAGDPRLEDAKALTRDLEVIARRIVDPLVLAYAEYAAQNWHGIDMSTAKDQLLGALEGNLFFEIENAAETADEEAIAYAIDDAAALRRAMVEID